MLLLLASGGAFLAGESIVDHNCVVSSRPCTTRRAPHIYPDMSGDGFQYHSSQLTFSDEWYCPQTMHPQDVGSTPGLSHSHRRALTNCLIENE